MRDILVTLLVFGSLPYILKKPYIGILMWVWIGVMNPHTLSWGFASSFPFAAIIAATTLTSLLVTKEPKDLPFTPVTWVLIAFVVWMNVTTVFALQPEIVGTQWRKVMKIMLMIFVPLMVLKTRQHVQLLIWVLVISVGFYGVKGGLFTITSGGQHLVWGPSNTFIGGNNEIALALIVIIPLMYYLQTTSEKTWVRLGLSTAMLLCAFAALGSYSRGALLAIAAMGMFLWLKSRKKVALSLLLLASIPALITFMPQKWADRMDTISTYKEDGSAMGRINAWQMAFNLARDRPLVGGGFEVSDLHIFERYAPVPTDVHAAHSIYFQALGEHGFVGLGLYLLLGLLTWRTGTWIIRNTAHREEYKWAYQLASMIQVSLVAFAVGGAFLSLLYFDVPYYLLVAMVVTRIIVEKELKAHASPSVSTRQPASQRPARSLASPPSGVNNPS